MLIRRAACRKVIRLTEESSKGFDRCHGSREISPFGVRHRLRTRWIVVLDQINLVAQFAYQGTALAATYSQLPVPDWTSLITRIT